MVRSGSAVFLLVGIGLAARLHELAAVADGVVAEEVIRALVVEAQNEENGVAEVEGSKATEVQNEEDYCCSPPVSACCGQGGGGPQISDVRRRYNNAGYNNAGYNHQRHNNAGYNHQRADRPPPGWKPLQCDIRDIGGNSVEWNCETNYNNDVPAGTRYLPEYIGDIRLLTKNADSTFLVDFEGCNTFYYYRMSKDVNDKDPSTMRVPCGGVVSGKLSGGWLEVDDFYASAWQKQDGFCMNKLDGKCRPQCRRKPCDVTPTGTAAGELCARSKEGILKGKSFCTSAAKQRQAGKAAAKEESRRDRRRYEWR